MLEVGLPSRRRFATELWDGTTLPATAGEDARLRLNSPKTLGRMLRLPLDVALGEAYIRGDFDIEGDFSAVVELADTFDAAPGWAAVPGLLRDYERLRRGAGAPPPAPKASLEGETHSRERDKAAVAAPLRRVQRLLQAVAGCSAWSTRAATFPAATKRSTRPRPPSSN